jgi:signal transduction histidine kinase
VENEIALHLYYIVLEALANAAKHSGGSNVDITLQPSGDRWLLTIQDDGIGFSLPLATRRAWACASCTIGRASSARL